MSAPACVFLSGIGAGPAAVSYRSLFGELETTGLRLIAKDLEICATDPPQTSFTIRDEIDGIMRVDTGNAAGRMHLYGHSAGAAVALAFVAAYPERVATLAIDEPATDFSGEDLADPNWHEIERALALPPDDAMTAFLVAQLAPGVAPPRMRPPRPGLAKRPLVATFADAIRQHRIPRDRYAAYRGPVLYLYGSLSNQRWERMRERLARTFSDLMAERFAGLHHLNPPHVAEPARVARLLRTHWGRERAP
ncbi:MAG: alpha/beta fold hydrolase [Chloroflexi bacterium]|nr:alpha/beta fold hydrolase [Chloroflexota bacterium]